MTVMRTSRPSSLRRPTYEVIWSRPPISPIKSYESARAERSSLCGVLLMGVGSRYRDLRRAPPIYRSDIRAHFRPARLADFEWMGLANHTQLPTLPESPFKP